MRLNEVEKRPYNMMRDVSDLRIQFQCEYRLHLKQKLGESVSEAGVTGSILHRLISSQIASREGKRRHRLLPYLFIIVSLIAGILWILW